MIIISISPFLGDTKQRSDVIQLNLKLRRYVGDMLNVDKEKSKKKRNLKNSYLSQLFADRVFQLVCTKGIKSFGIQYDVHMSQTKQLHYFSMLSPCTSIHF